ncbi:hypothetical protein Cha6605_6081 (plasmid) [Chamaesiphon minutus PCC 6605]|uniref:Uncharacterized protein n=1 Tax=Chamaesiphon minutus (strain ATCC 27169 / PCC 6605) TaxID=1173020 RepID=K9UPA3_CHAP6|nr:hypothetical protein Cha6605_6081 [Chamaesiphon minutus PCC 6605]
MATAYWLDKQGHHVNQSLNRRTSKMKNMPFHDEITLAEQTEGGSPVPNVLNQ